MKFLVIGDGLLGNEIIKKTNWDYISRKKNGIDFNVPETYSNSLDGYDTVINCVACTNTYNGTKDEHYNTNFKSVTILSDICSQKKIKLVHISTDYVYASSKYTASEEDLPLISPNWYTYYKLLADEYIMLKNDNYIICRCSFKPYPFPYDLAWGDQYGNFDYVDVIAGLIIKLLNNNPVGLFNIGTEIKTIFDLANKTKNNVKKSDRPLYVPENVTMNLEKLNKILKK